MDATAAQITAQRLRAQQLAQPQWRDPERLVRWLGGVQAQNPAWAHWSIGLRLRDGNTAEVEREIVERRVVRTWAFRGTLHYLAATDLAWLLSVLAPTLIRRNARRYRQLALDEPTFAQSNQVIRTALEPGRPLLRSELARALESAGISAEGQRIHYLVQRAALDGVICLGPQQGRDPTYVLVAHWLGAQTASVPDNPPAALAERYFSSHGPATVQDFAWWSGLPVGAARQALDAAPDMVRVEAEGKTLWTKESPTKPSTGHTAHLLPPYDDYLLGYKDRSWALDPAYAKQVNAGGGMPKPTLAVDGQIVGTWSRAIQAARIVVSLNPFQPLDANQRGAVHAAAVRYADFHSRALEVMDQSR